MDNLLAAGERVPRRLLAMRTVGAVIAGTADRADIRHVAAVAGELYVRMFEEILPA